MSAIKLFAIMLIFLFSTVFCRFVSVSVDQGYGITIKPGILFASITPTKTLTPTNTSTPSPSATATVTRTSTNTQTAKLSVFLDDHPTATYPTYTPTRTATRAPTKYYAPTRRSCPQLALGTPCP